MLQKKYCFASHITVGVAQLVERQTVDLDVAGSNPVTHPMIVGAPDHAATRLNFTRSFLSKPSLNRFSTAKSSFR
jgi:hypothetical protein